LHRCQVLDHLRVLGSTQLEVLKFLNGGVVNVQMDDGAVIGWPKKVEAGSQGKKLINDLSIPRLEDTGQNQETEMSNDERSRDQKNGGTRFSFANGAQE